MISRRALLGTSVLPALVAQKPPLRVGLQIYSLRSAAEKDLPGTLARIRAMGFEEVEVAGFYGRRPAEFRRLLDAAALKATSIGAEYDRMAKDLDLVADEAHTLGAEYVVCGTIPHKRKHLAAKECTPAAEALNQWGERLVRSGLRCCYHTHGIEFDPAPGGTVFDTLARLADSKFVNFEMDIFWIVYGYQDPVKLLHRYPGRFPLMHVKDIRKGTALGGSPADVQEEDSVPLGTGLVEVAVALRAGRETGVRHFYIEDEAVDAEPQIRQSLRYLESIRW